LVEISVVDRPANPDALIETYKASNAEGFMPEIAFVSKETATGETAKVEKSETVLSDKDDAMLKEVRDKVAKFFKGQDVDIEAMSDEDKVEVSKADLYNLVKDFVKDAVAEEENAEASDDAENEEKEEETPAEETPAEEDEKSEEVEEEKAEEEKAEETTEVEKEDDAEEVKPEEEKPEEETPAEEKAEEVKEETEVEKSNAVDFKAEFAKMSEVLEKKFGERLDKIEKMI
jgi:flagellar biosynthesis GTPase FlhF